jgi:hypothetical protein
VRGSPETYLQLWKYAKAQVYPEIDAYEDEVGYKIDTDFYNDLGLHTQVCIKGSNICYAHGRVVYSTLRKFIADNPQDFYTILETGTARGFSALCMAKALHDAGVKGSITTYDIIFIAGDTKTTLKRSEVDFAFLDGGHTYEDVCHEFSRLVNPKVVVFDDYTPSQFPGVCKAIDETPLNKRYLHAARGYAIGVRE